MPAPQNIIKTSREDKILEEFRPTSVNFDIAPSEVSDDTWTQLANFYMRPGFALRSNGESNVFGDQADAPVNLINVVEGTTNFWVVMNKSTVTAIDQSNVVTDITPAVYVGPLEAGGVNSTIINGFPVQNFNQDPPTFWDKQVANACQTLPNWPANLTAKSIRSFKFFLIAMNLVDQSNEFPEALRWSNAAEPGSVPNEWAPLPTNQAGSTELSSTEGGIIDGLALRGQFMIYKNHSTYNCNFTGGTFVFAFRKFLTTSGILANNCVAEVEGQHVVLTDGDVILHDGQNVRSLVDKTMRKFIFEQIDPDSFENSFVFNYRASKEVWICFPTQGFTDPNLAVVWDYAHNLLSARSLTENWSHAASGTVLATTALLSWDQQVEDWNEANGTWNRAQFTGAFERALAGVPVSTFDSNARILFIDDSVSHSDGSAVTGVLTRESMDLGAPESFKYVRRIWPRLQGSTGIVVLIRVGVQDDPTSGITWTPQQPFRINVDNFLNFDVSGRFISVRFEDNSSPTAEPQAIWGCHGFDLEYTLQGDFSGIA